MSRALEGKFFKRAEHAGGNEMIGVAEIKKMSRKEKLRVMELLWDSLDWDDSKQEIESPAWHDKIVSERLAHIERGEGKFLTIAQVKQRLARKRK